MLVRTHKHCVGLLPGLLGVAKHPAFSALILTVVAQNVWEVLPHLAYSTNQSRRDFDLFRPLKKLYKDNDSTQMQTSLLQWFNAESKLFVQGWYLLSSQSIEYMSGCLL